MNFPGTFGSPNWCWRVDGAMLDGALAKRIYDLTALYGRTAK
jgi:4-alpha-glucanotransferase